MSDTEVARLREELARVTRERDESRRVFDEFHYAVLVTVYDMATAITSVAGMTELLAKHPSSDDERRERLEWLGQGCEWLGAYRRALFRLVIAHQRVPAVRPVDVGTLARRACERSSEAAGAVDVIIQWAPMSTGPDPAGGPQGWPSVLGDEDWVMEMYETFLRHAIRFGGEPSRVELGATPTGDGQVEFWVAGNGPGLPAHLHDLLLRHSRLSHTGAPEPDLFTAAAVAYKLGSTVAVDGPPGGSPRLSFTLPLVEP
ncbi:sensor histidine kinase [Haliangium sp.]|uniref:sensor histidine kinase n=1 Tax=Haliangium sp. TaxID=2663208 RepID=UPI003D0AF7D7